MPRTSHYRATKTLWEQRTGQSEQRRSWRTSNQAQMYLIPLNLRLRSNSRKIWRDTSYTRNISIFSLFLQGTLKGLGSKFSYDKVCMNETSDLARGGHLCVRNEGLAFSHACGHFCASAFHSTDSEKKRDCSSSNKWSARNKYFSARRIFKMYLSRCPGEAFRTSANVFYDRNCSLLTELQDTFKINEKSRFCFCCWSLQRILNWQNPNAPDPLTSYPKLRSIYWRDSLTVITGQRLLSSAIRCLVEQAYKPSPFSVKELDSCCLGNFTSWAVCPKNSS